MLVYFWGVSSQLVLFLGLVPVWGLEGDETEAHHLLGSLGIL